MSDRSPDAVASGIRLVLGGLCIAGGFVLLARGGTGIVDVVGFVLLGSSLVLAGALLLQPTVSAWLARPAGKLFYPDARFDRAVPLYSVAESKAMKEDFEGALALYREIAEAHPGEVKPHVDSLRIVVVHLHDLPRADALYRGALDALADPLDRERLSEAYRGIRSLAAAPPEWSETRTLSLPPGHESAASGDA